MTNLAVKYKQQAQEEVQIQTPPQQMAKPKVPINATYNSFSILVIFALTFGLAICCGGV
jgi:hypothetical protein